MLQRTAVGGLNHILAQQEWPLARLQAFARRTITLRLSPFPDLRLQIREDGLLEEAPPGAPDAAADLTVTLKPAALPRILQRDESAMRDIELTGAADLAQLVQQLFRDLAWDVEEDLSQVFGDVVAHRMVSSGRNFMAWQKDAAQRLAQNFADYWTEKRPLILRKEAASGFSTDVAWTRDRVDAIERRIEALERRKTST